MEYRQAWVHRKQGRYYSARLVRDLFNELTVVQVWGGRGTRRGGHAISPVASVEEGMKLIDGIDRRRASRGYSRVH
ncbi:WGR domain-containing protein [Thioalkalivibrio sp. ALMg11]|uniref:WGR domain-containing protein n=1 Tax=Thioalkalivibrio sp. ALMg11 TaxID=1158165 RepID=UPI0003819DFA|nr:WGR domain-containing protein [Thioalkalivibrio sp. ALMg11]